MRVSSSGEHSGKTCGTIDGCGFSALPARILRVLDGVSTAPYDTATLASHHAFPARHALHASRG
eukprot:5017486-Pleurochrysis_carterae.AAC.5